MFIAIQNKKEEDKQIHFIRFAKTQQVEAWWKKVITSPLSFFLKKKKKEKKN